MNRQFLKAAFGLFNIGYKVSKVRKLIGLFLLGLLPTLIFSACGYSLSSSPYRLDLKGETLTMSIPVAANRSRFGRLGPALTKEVIERLSGTPGLIIQAEGAEAKLSLTIMTVTVGSGSWDVVGTSTRDTPEASSSRTATVGVSAALTRPNPKGGPPISKRSSFYSSRTYMVSVNQGQVEMQEAEALDWIIEDISQKIGLVMFNEF
ncbi:MAG: LPS assembly lipoprotein LptE [Deltaproteobacteria bacterium]|jgi:hypothetical protein|nr:LPS assembly lipoprotein LptE [Deltaproteobacteria bacterium]